MLSSFRWLLVAMALGATIAFGACGDSNNDTSDEKTDEQPVATDDTSSDGSSDNGNQDGGNADSGGNGSDEVPLPDGADEQGSGTYSSSQIPFPVFNEDFDSEVFGTVEWKLYEVEQSAADVISFYQGEFSDWDEVFVSTAGAEGNEGGFGVWTTDDGRRAVWVGVGESGGSTQMTLIVGNAD
ncbi:MAG: hypothetical protein WBD55_05050 [Dehalococcoidia bacterium]